MWILDEENMERDWVKKTTKGRKEEEERLVRRMPGKEKRSKGRKALEV